MSREREFSDPVITSVRAERADIELAKALDIRLSAALRNGIRNLAEGYIETLKECPRDWQELLIHLKKRDVEESETRFKSEERSRIMVAEQVALRKKVVTEVHNEAKTPSDSDGINWSSVPEHLKISKYIQVLMPVQQDREIWITKYIDTEDDEDKFQVATSFAKSVVELYKADPEKPVQIKDLNEIRRVLSTWAEAVGGV